MRKGDYLFVKDGVTSSTKIEKALKLYFILMAVLFQSPRKSTGDLRKELDAMTFPNQKEEMLSIKSTLDNIVVDRDALTSQFSNIAFMTAKMDQYDESQRQAKYQIVNSLAAADRKIYENYADIFGKDSSFVSEFTQSNKKEELSYDDEDSISKEIQEEVFVNTTDNNVEDDDV
ncbi:MAG: hypothetical protein SGARI_003951 [Bacillariaceae sp.]